MDHPKPQLPRLDDHSGRHDPGWIAPDNEYADRDDFEGDPGSPPKTQTGRRPRPPPRVCFDARSDPRGLLV